MRSLLERFRKYIDLKSLCTPDDRILLTVSGGVDSMTMLSLFTEAGYEVGVAHCNFQLRGRESEEDEELVHGEAARLGVPVYNKRFDTQYEIDNSGQSLQMVARRLRYQWFEELCSEHGYNKIAIAHHADDSVETFFINMMRGTGLRGLTGIGTMNGPVIRPLLFATRREIVEYARAHGVKFREDSSNLSTKYLRNKIRLGIIPRIKEIYPGFTDTMTGNVERLTEALEFIECSIDKIRGEVEAAEDGRVVMDMSRLDGCYPRPFVVFELLRKYGFNGDVTESICRSIGAEGCSGRRFYSKDKVAYIDRDRIVVTDIPEDDDCETAVVEAAGHVAFMGYTLVMERVDIDQVETLDCGRNTALLDRDKLAFPLTVRRWRDGDSFVPFGMTGHKKVSDFLIDAKVPLPDKERQAVVLSGDEIVWLVGHRIDDRYAVKEDTENILRITKDSDIIY